MVAVVTRGTMTDAEMLSTHPDASFFLTLAEAPAAAAALAAADGGAGAAVGGTETAEVREGSGGSGDEQMVIGACAVDVATGQILIGQWCAPKACIRGATCSNLLGHPTRSAVVCELVEAARCGKLQQYRVATAMWCCASPAHCRRPFDTQRHGRPAQIYMYNICRQDGELRAGLRSHLASLQPVELVLPKNASGKTRRVVRGAEGAPRLNEVPATEAWDAARTRRELLKADYWPQAPPLVLQVR